MSIPPPVFAVAGYTGITHAPSQVAALMEYRDLKYLAPNVFPKDVIARADELLEEIGSVGAYSHSQGVPLIRKHVAEFIHGLCSSSHPFAACGLPERGSRM